MAHAGGADTIAEFVHATLRAEILGGTLAPGERLKVMDLRRRLGVSISVLREALTRLAGQGLVVLEPNLGFTVTRLSAEALDQLIDVRRQVEPLALRRSIAHGDLEWEAECTAAHHRLSRLPRRRADGRVSPEWAAAHRQFHLQLLAGSGNAVLVEISTDLFDRAELYRYWSSAARGHRPVEKEHRQLLDAAISRDQRGASRLLAQHIARTATRVLQTET